MLAQILTGRLTIKQAASLGERQHRLGPQQALVPHGASRTAAETSILESPRRRRRLTVGRVARASVPYLLILPVLVAVGAILGYLLYSLVRLSFQHYGLFELIAHEGQPVGLDNYRSVLHDQVFRDTLCDGRLHDRQRLLTMVIGTLLALLLVRVSLVVRLLLTGGLILAWSMPTVVAVQVWYWMTNYENGILNYVLPSCTSVTSSTTTGTRRRSRSSRS